MAAGVSAYIVAGLAPERIRPILEVAMARFQHEQELRRELADARSELNDRKVIDRAKGLLMQRQGLSEGDAKMWLDFIAMVTPVIAGVFITNASTNAKQVEAIVKMPDDEKAKALENVSPIALAGITAAMPDEAKVASILAMPPAATAAAVAQLSDADQADFVASLPDKAVVTAAGLMPGVEVMVSKGASPSALEAAHDENVPGVNPV